MNKWPLFALKDLGEVTTGSTPPSNNPTYFGGTTPFVTPADLDNVSIIMTTPRSLSDKGTTKARLLPAETVLVSCIGNLGKMGFAGKPVVTNQQINAITFDQNKVFPRYGFYACSLLKKQLETMAPATTLPIVSKSKFEKLQIPLPPLKEQKRIAAILDQADVLRRLRQRSIDRLNSLGQAIFYEMFGDPVSNPMGWPIGAIRDLVSEVKYGTSQKAHSEPDGLPMLRMGNLTFSGSLDLTNLKFVHLSDKDFGKYTTCTGDILFNRTNSKELVGKTVVFDLDEPYAIAGYLIRVRVNEEANPYYISAYLNSSHGKSTLQNMCKNIVGMANINAQELQEIVIAKPPIALQNEYATKIKELKKNAGIFDKSINMLDALFLSLQHRAFNGELSG